jgi:hypothetical protein
MFKSKVYLPLKCFHIVPIYGVQPDQIKQSAQNLIQDREKIKHNTCLNGICKALGFEGGFAGYKCEYKEKLQPFLEKHGMVIQSDLLSPRMPWEIQMWPLRVQISPRDLSDRLFKSGKSLPRKIFTGYNYDFWSKYEDGFWYLNHVVSYFHSKVIFAFENWKACLPLALENPNLIIKGQGHWPDRTLMDVFLGGFMHYIMPSFHLIGDALVKPMLGEGWQTKIYFRPEKYSSSSEMYEEKEKYDQLFKAFRDQIKRGDEGWVEVVPYNEKLIFLKGTDGEYDFTFLNLRDKPFDHNIFEPYLKNADIPKQNGTYRFQRWYYYEYAGWKERDEHEAEKHFYASDGKVSGYPGVDEVYMRYQIHIGNYKPHVLSAGKSGGFKEAEINSMKYYVSDLITIDEFRSFRKDNPDYFRYRQGDNLSSMNQDASDMPVAVTWYDANAYATWIR